MLNFDLFVGQSIYSQLCKSGEGVAAKRFGSKYLGLMGDKKLPWILVMTYTYTALAKDLSGFAVGLCCPLSPVDACKMQFLGAGVPG